MNPISPWALAGLAGIKDAIKKPPVYSTSGYVITYTVLLSSDSLWLLAEPATAARVCIRLAFSAGMPLRLIKCAVLQNALNIEVAATSGHYQVHVLFNNKGSSIRYTTRFTPAADLVVVFWPRDILITNQHFTPGHDKGDIHVKQVGCRSGMFYCTSKALGGLLYLQHLTALSEYCELTGNSCKEVVGGNWPELGLALPPTNDKVLPAGKDVTISDGILVFDKKMPGDELALAQQYLDLLAAAYLQLPLPSTVYKDWPAILDKGLKDLRTPGCWAQFAGNSYLNAYVCDYKTPPEIMVQLAVLLPLIDYAEWSGTPPPEIPLIKKCLPEFYNKELKTIMRWLPAAEGALKGEEEQKKPGVMDSWYLHHPLLNLSRLALKGDKQAKKLFLDSLPFAIRVARHFKYNWPVFYQMDTLEIVKAETTPGKGGEKDVAGLYTLVMVQAYELTGSNSYLREAEKAARSLRHKGFELLYQSNNTAFAAGALLRLHKITGKKVYLQLSYVCLANLFSNVQLWDCHYGLGKHFPRFFGLFPLKDAPYTAVYEEQESFCALHDYIQHSRGVAIHPSANLLIAEYIRYLIHRAVYYYPPMLPGEVLSAEVKMGEVDPALWIALEDLYDGREKAGQVGQEVYGAGNAFGILPRHCFIVKDKRLRFFVEYPVTSFREKTPNTVAFHTGGSEVLTCRLLVLKQPRQVLPALTVQAGSASNLVGKRTREGNMEYTIRGNQRVIISWKRNS